MWYLLGACVKWGVWYTATGIEGDMWELTDGKGNTDKVAK
jgi:hypothetical protein